jgi:hypothetical protein
MQPQLQLQSRRCNSSRAIFPLLLKDQERVAALAATASCLGTFCCVHTMASSSAAASRAVRMQKLRYALHLAAAAGPRSAAVATVGAGLHAVGGDVAAVAVALRALRARFSCPGMAPLDRRQRTPCWI